MHTSALPARQRTAATLLALLLLAALAPARPAAAATFTVTKTADTADGACTTDCSLREAIIAANATPAADTITLPAGTYTLTLASTAEDAAADGDLDVLAPLTLAGAGASRTTLTISGTADRLLHIFASPVTVSGLTIRGGNASGDVGGGILVEQGAALTLAGSHVTANRADSGGGIAAYGTVALDGVTVSANTARLSGGIDMYRASAELPAPALSITNSTISGNSADGSAGGIGVFGGSLTLTSATVTANVADSNADNGGDGGGVLVDEGPGPTPIASASMVGTILAGNTDRSPTAVAPDCSGTITTLGYNLTQDEAGCFVVGVRDGDAIEQAPALGALQDNGGGIPTHALLPSSPALDRGDAPGGWPCPATDQRGSVRPADADGDGSAGCDIGALELLPTSLVLVAPGTTAAAAPGTSFTVSATVRNDGPGAVPDATVTATLPPGASYHGGAGAGWTCASAAGTVTCSYGAIAAGGSSSTLEITAIAPTFGGQIVTTLLLSSTAPDASTEDNDAAVTTARGEAQFLPMVGK